MHWILTDSQALAMGLTHHARYYGIPVYVGNLEFSEEEPIDIALKYRVLTPVLDVISLIEWLFTPPNAKSLFLITGAIPETTHDRHPQNPPQTKS